MLSSTALSFIVMRVCNGTTTISLPPPPQINSDYFPCFSKDPNNARPFEGLKIVDVGCGGGILSEVFLQYFEC